MAVRRPVVTAQWPERAGQRATRGSTCSPGDVLLIRAGWWKKGVAERSPRTILAGEPGLGLESAAWLHAREVAAVAVDNDGVEVLPNDHVGTNHPLQLILTADRACPSGEWFDLDALSAECAEDGVYKSFLSRRG